MQNISNKSCEEFIALCKETIFELPIESAIEYAEQVGLLLCANPLGIYSLNDVEFYLVNAIYPLVPPELKKRKVENRDGKNILFLATELYLTGGHSRLMERLALFLDGEASLFLTKIPCESILDRERNFFNKVSYFDSKCHSAIDKVFSILDVILKYDIVILNTHQEDIYAIIACGIAKRINSTVKIIFINHADHSFSYGSAVADIWYEISAYGRYIDRKRELRAKKCFLGIPIQGADEFNSCGCEFKDGDLIISAGSNIKFKPIKNQSIIKLVHLLLDTYQNSKMQVIGVQPFRDYWWWLSKLKYRQRLKLSKLLSYPDYLNTTKAAKLYVDSYPIPGGTAFTEQLLQGRFCVGLESEFKGYTPVEIFKCQKESQVIDCIKKIGEQDFTLIRNMVNDMHGFINVKRRFLNSVHGDIISTYTYWKECENINELKVHRIKHIPYKLKIYKKRDFRALFRGAGIFALSIYMLRRYILNKVR